MLRLFKWIAPVVALGLMSLFVNQNARGDEPTSQPTTAATGSITVTVVDANSKPVADVNVNLFAAKPIKKPAPTKSNKALAKGTTDAEGKYTFSNLAHGDYRIDAILVGVGHGKGKVAVTDDVPNPTLTITLKPSTSGTEEPKTPASGATPGTDAGAK